MLSKYIFVHVVTLQQKTNSIHTGAKYRIAHRLNKTSVNKAIVDYNSPALCTAVTPFPPIGNADYRQHTGRGPSHRHGQHIQKNLVKITDVVSVGQTDRQAGRQADRQTDALITKFCNRSHGEVMNATIG